MDDNLLPDLLSQLFPDVGENKLAPGGDKTAEQNNILAATLKALAGQSSGPVGTAVNEFLTGKGALHETTRSALSRGSGSAVSEVVAFLTTQLKLSPAAAQLIVPLLLKLLPSIGKETGTDSTTEKKPRRKTKPKSPSSAKNETGSIKKKPIKKTLARPKTSAAKPEAKKKLSTRADKKKTASAKKPNNAKRTTSLDAS